MHRVVWILAGSFLLVTGLAGLTGSGRAWAASPFIMVVNSDSGPNNQYFSILNTYALTTDFFGAKLASFDGPLGNAVSPSHLFATPPKLANVQGRAATSCSSGLPELILYEAADGDTPVDELGALVHSVKVGSGYIANSPNTCHTFGVSFGPDYVGINIARCSFSPNYISNNAYNGYNGTNIFRGAFDWAGVSLIVIEAQQLLNDGTASPGHTTKCASPNQVAYVDNYVLALQMVVAQLRTVAPNAAIATQLSFRYTNPTSMIGAMSALSGAGGVDGFYLAYPLDSTYPCTYCTATDLQMVLSALRPS